MEKPPRNRREPEQELGRILAIARAAARAAGANAHEAEEAAQTTAAKLWEKWESPHIQRALEWEIVRWEGYIRRTAKNVHYDLVRGHQRRISRQGQAAAPSMIGFDETGAMIACTSSAADIEACMARTLIGEEIANLPERQRQVAALVLLAGLTPNEASERLGIQPQSVRKNLKAARLTLQRRLSHPDLFFDFD